MKNYSQKFSYLFALLLIIGIVACTEEETPDVAPPTGQFTSPVNGNPGGDIVFSGTVNDDAGIKSIMLVSTDLSLDKTITPAGSPTSYTLDYTHSVPAEVVDGTYPVTITVTNTADKSSEFSVDVVLVTEILDNYEAIWVAGGVLWWEWGTPEGYFYEMTKDTENEGWFEIKLPSWAGFNEIKFLAQNAWADGTTGEQWAVEDQNAAVQVIIKDDAADGDPMILPDLGKNPAYYLVRFNPNTMDYSLEEIVPSDPAPAEMFIVGKGFTDYPNLDWNPEEAIPMTANPYEYGEYQFLAEGLNFSADVAIKFIGQNTGWSPIDVGFDETYLEDADSGTDGWQIIAPANWKPTKAGDGTADLKFVDQAGAYTVYFDYFLMRAVIWPE